VSAWVVGPISEPNPHIGTHPSRGATLKESEVPIGASMVTELSG
jgi:hypothetical protein